MVSDALQTLATFNSVRLIWVPGHCGITSNEKVDLLAKQASPPATLALNHLLVSVYLLGLFIVLSVHGLYMNKINCGKSYLDADKLNVS